MERRARLDFSKRVLLAVSIAIAVGGAVWLFCEFSQVLLFIFAGLLLGVLLQGLAALLTRLTGLWPGVSLTLVVVAMLAVIGVGCCVIGPRLAAQSADLAKTIPKGFDTVREEVESSWAGAVFSYIPPMSKMLPAPRALLGDLPGFLSTTSEAAAMALFIFFLGIYTAANPQIYRESLIRLAPLKKRERLREIADLLGHALRWWLLGRIVTMTVMGALTAFGLWLLGVPMALSLGVIAGLLQFVPYLGAIVAAIPALLIAFTQSPLMTAEVAALYVVIHLVEGYCVTPLIQQRAIALPPAALLTMQLLMGVLFGIPGVMLASPLTVVFIVLVQTLYLQDILGDSVSVLGSNHPAHDS